VWLCIVITRKKYLSRLNKVSIIESIREGAKVPDVEFNELYPKGLRALALTHWTPVRVATRAAELLVTNHATKILDVGAGAGKFCIVGALTSDATFVGIEHRKELVKIATGVATQYKIERVKFKHGNMQDVDWSAFNGFYLYNPFIENVYDEAARMKNGFEQMQALYEKYIDIVRDKLKKAATGTCVVTYWGFGGPMPAGYVLKTREKYSSDALELWMKES
jgi:hypothetical protein